MPVPNKPLLTNAEDADGDYWDPWEALGLGCLSYNSAIDDQAIAVLEGIRAKKYCDDIAAAIGMSVEHVELFQGIFCSAGWCDYGTSPRACFESHDSHSLDDLIGEWRAYRLRHWNDAPPPPAF